MKINYNDEKHYVPFSAIRVGDVFVTEVGGNKYSWIKVETSHTEESKVEFNAVCLDSADVTLIARNVEVVNPESYHMDVNFF